MSDNLPETLVPGSIWQHTKHGKYVTVLLLSNIGLKPELAEKFPAQVVFLTNDFQIQNQPIDMFLRLRKSYDHDPVMAAHIEALTTEQEELPDDLEVDLSELPMEDDSYDPLDAVQGEPETQVAAESEEDTPIDDGEAHEVHAEIITDDADEPVNPMRLDVGDHPYAQQLADALVSYSEVPYPTGDTMHILNFELGKTGLSLEAIREAFYVKDPKAIQGFVLDNVYERTEVDIDCYVDTFLTIKGGKAYGALYVTSAGDFRNGALEEAIANMEAFVAEPDLINAVQGTPETGTAQTIVQVEPETEPTSFANDVVQDAPETEQVMQPTETVQGTPETAPPSSPEVDLTKVEFTDYSVLAAAPTFAGNMLNVK